MRSLVAARLVFALLAVAPAVVLAQPSQVPVQ